MGENGKDPWLPKVNQYIEPVRPGFSTVQRLLIFHHPNTQFKLTILTIKNPFGPDRIDFTC